MRKFLLQVSFALLIYTSTYGQTEQNLSVKTAIVLLNKDTQSADHYVQGKGYRFVGTHGNFRQYKKGLQFSYDFTLAQRNSSITGLSWTEFLGNYDEIRKELEGMGFKVGITGSHVGGEVSNYKNLSKNIMITLITRNDYNDFTITLGSIKAVVPVKVKQPVTPTQKAVRIDKVPVQVTDNFLINMPIPPSAISQTPKSLATSDFYSKNGTQVGIIQKTFKGQEGELWLTICYKDRLNESDIKGYILVDINTADYFDANGDSNEISKTDRAYFRQIILPGRRVEFQTYSRGSGVLRYDNLVYIKPLPNSSVIVNGAIKIEKYFVGG